MATETKPGPWGDAVKGFWADDTFIVSPHHQEQYRSALSKQVRAMTGGQWDLAPLSSCKCGSGSNVRGPGHSDWCDLRAND